MSCAPGSYEQGRGQLRKGDAYCCLGVASELYRRTYGKGHWKENDSGDLLFSIGGESEVGILPIRVRDALGLDDSEGSYYNDENKLTSLVLKNDNVATFAEIADIIESEPAGLFVEKEASP